MIIAYSEGEEKQSAVMLDDLSLTEFTIYFDEELAPIVRENLHKDVWVDGMQTLNPETHLSERIAVETVEPVSQTKPEFFNPIGIWSDLKEQGWTAEKLIDRIRGR